MGRLTSFVKKGNLTANGQTLVLDVTQAHSAVILLSGTYNMTIQFEVSDDDATVWYPVRAVQANADTNASSHSTTNATVAYELNVSNYSRLRVRVSAFTSGNCAVVLTASEAEAEPNPTVGGVVALGAGTQSIGSVTANAATPTTSQFASAASTNAAVVKSTAGRIFSMIVSNPTATAASVKLYNKATAPTVGTDVPIATVTVAAGGIAIVDCGALGHAFSAGLGRAVTALPAATDTGNAVAGVQVSIAYL